MTTISSNIITHGMSGKRGKTLVFSQRNRISSLISVSKTDEPKPLQLQQVTLYCTPSERSSGATISFNKISPNTIEIAIADMLQAPDIEKIDMSEYYGRPGDRISVTVTYDFRATGVKVFIYNPDNTLAEEGLAVQEENEIDWIYTIKSLNTLPGDKIVIQACDGNGNFTTESNILF